MNVTSDKIPLSLQKLMDFDTGGGRHRKGSNQISPHHITPLSGPKKRQRCQRDNGDADIAHLLCSINSSTSPLLKIPEPTHFPEDKVKELDQGIQIRKILCTRL
jgi:hypothetical protein